jgi:hypothetical protein
MVAFVSSWQLRAVWLESVCFTAARAGSKAFGVVFSCAVAALCCLLADWLVLVG